MVSLTPTLTLTLTLTPTPKPRLQLDGALEELECDVVLLLQREAVADDAARVGRGTVEVDRSLCQVAQRHLIRGRGRVRVRVRVRARVRVRVRVRVGLGQGGGT